MKFSTIPNIRKYRGLHERHHFIPMAMEVYGALGHDMDRSSRSVHDFSMIDDRKVIYLCLFAFNFSSNMSILLFNMF